LVIFFFFFFQAEDGIRDGHVTGVQTCALPICQLVLVGGHHRRVLLSLEICRSQGTVQGRLCRGDRVSQGSGTRRTGRTEDCLDRSEERRVGKEWRARGAGDQWKKKEDRRESEA